MDIERQDLDRSQDLILAALREVKGDLHRLIDDRADALNARLDKLNGKTILHGEKLATLEERSQSDIWARIAAAVAAVLASFAAVK